MNTSVVSLPRRLIVDKRIWLCLIAVGLAIAVREHFIDSLIYALHSLWLMAPIVLIGLFVTGALTATGSIGVLVSTFDGREITAIVLVSLIGAVLPVCGITVLPLVMGLLSAGVPLAPVMAFLLSSAVTDPQMFAITMATLGLPFALGKTFAALCIGLMGGAVTLMLTRSGLFSEPARKSPLLASLNLTSSCCADSPVVWRFWSDPERLKLFTSASIALAKLVLFWLGIAFVAEYFLKLYVPDEALAGIVGSDNPYSVPIAAIIGTPLYLDGYAALPFVRGLMDRGMAEGAAMAFLIAGGITSAWTALPVLSLFRLPVFLTYMLLAVSGAMLSGWVYGLSMA